MKRYLLPLLFLACGPAFAVDILRTAAQPQSEPKFVGAEAPGHPPIEGLCVDLYRAIERTDGRLAFTGDQQWSPPARIDASIAAGQLDVACAMVKTDARAGGATMAEPALFALNYVLLTRAADPVAVTRLSDIARLDGENVVLSMMGTGPSRQLAAMPGLRVDAGSSGVRQNLHKLLLGRGRFFYYRLPALNPVIRESCARREIRVLPAVMRTEPTYMMIGKHVAPAVSQRIGAALRKLKDSGELDQLLRKWKVGDDAVASC
jgi:ABC-type amino acid transport substrate-binding protein